jgi:hypothetical protein
MTTGGRVCWYPAFASYNIIQNSPTGRSGPVEGRIPSLLTLASIFVPPIPVRNMRSFFNNGARRTAVDHFREAENLSLRRATTRCTCICSCTVLESYPSVRVSPILALTCVNTERALLSRSDTPSDLVFFAPYASLRGVESCSSSSPPAGRPASRYSVLDGSLAGRPTGRHADGALQRDWTGIPGTCRGSAFFARARWRREWRRPALPG